jgi:hypothetical protein
MLPAPDAADLAANTSWTAAHPVAGTAASRTVLAVSVGAAALASTAAASRTIVPGPEDEQAPLAANDIENAKRTGLMTGMTDTPGPHKAKARRKKAPDAPDGAGQARFRRWTASPTFVSCEHNEW